MPDGLLFKGGPLKTGDPNASHDTLTGTDWTSPLSRTNRLPGQNYFDTSVDETLIPQQTNRDFEGELDYGLDKNDLGGTGDAGFTSGNDPMASALSARYEEQANNSLQSVLAQNREHGVVAKSGAENTASRELSAERQNEVQNFNAQYSYQIQRQNLYNQYQQALSQAQAGLFGAIFGGIGAIGGAVLGGPAGAIAGGAAGSGVGKAAGR